VGSEDFGSIMASIDAPMIVVTAAMDDERAGCLVGFHSQSSIEPERIAVWMSKANHTYRVMLRSEHFGVHYLTADDDDLAELFGTLTGDEVDKLARTESHAGPHGVPVLERCQNRLVVRRTALLDEGGDHVCIAAEPIDVTAAGPCEPLRLAQVAHLTPGHEVGERHDPPTERAADA